MYSEWFNFTNQIIKRNYKIDEMKYILKYSLEIHKVFFYW